MSTDHDSLAYMEAMTLSAFRDANIYASDSLDTLLGGLWITEGITNANFYSMIEIFCIFTDTFDLQLHGGPLVARDNSQLQPGNYFVVTNGYITVTDEVPLLRAISQCPATSVESFRDAVRQRDRHCVLTGRPTLMAIFDGRPKLTASCDRWTGFDASYIFPLGYEGHWNDCHFSRCITVPPAAESDRSINSPQNGLLLNAAAHELFASYLVSINPDDNYKIVSFGPFAVNFGITSHLNKKFLDHPLRPSDQLLRWHFRQAVLINMKGTGEPFFDKEYENPEDWT